MSRLCSICYFHPTWVTDRHMTADRSFGLSLTFFILSYIVSSDCILHPVYFRMDNFNTHITTGIPQSLRIDHICYLRFYFSFAGCIWDSQQFNILFLAIFILNIIALFCLNKSVFAAKNTNRNKMLLPIIFN